MKKKLKDLTRDEMYIICDAVSRECSKCPLYNKRSDACARLYFDTKTSKFDDEELNVEIETGDFE